MERIEDDGNLYNTFKPSRLTRRERDQDLDERFLHPDLIANDRVSIQKFSRDDFKRGLMRHYGEQPFPIQPKIGPYEVTEVAFGAKNYYWCSCGMSQSQPFCDKSHIGTNFKPLKFSLDEKADKMHLCGCKLSSEAPFCDKVTCKRLLNGERINAKEGAYVTTISDEENSSSSSEDEAE